MIDRVLCKKYVGQAALLWFSCAAALFAFAWVRVWVVSLLNMKQFSTILNQFRDFEKFSPIPFDQLITYEGRVGATFDEPIVLLCVIVWCVARGSDVVSGELSRGTLEMLLAQPVSRTRLLASHAVVSTLGLVGLVSMVWLGMWFGIQLTTFEETIDPPSFRIPWIGIEIPASSAEPETVTVSMREKVDPALFTASVLNLFAFGFFMLGISSLASSWDRYRWRTIGTVIAVYVLQSVMYGLGKSAEALSWLEHATFLTCYRPQKLTMISAEEGISALWRWRPIEGEVLGPMMFPTILIVLGGVAYLLAALIFRRRDLPAPL